MFEILEEAGVGRRPSDLWTANVMLMTPRMGRYVLSTAFSPGLRSEAIKQRKKWLPRAVAALNASGRFLAFNRLEWEWPQEAARWWRATHSYFRFYVKDPMLRWPPMSDLPREEPDVDPEGIF